MIQTTPLYWDCECKTNFIHPKNKNKCKKCGAQKRNQPDSRLNEVEEHIKIKLYGKEK
jgi:hypothetical protein